MTDEHSKITADVIRAALALGQRDVELGLITVEQIEAIPRTRFAPVERKKIAQALSAQGLSTREIAKRTCTNHSTIVRDLAGANAPETGANAPPQKERDDGDDPEASLDDLIDENDRSAQANEASINNSENRASKVANMKNGKANGVGYRIAIPDGYSNLRAAIMAGVELERRGKSSEDIAKQIGVGKRTYTIGRDAVLLSKLPDLSAKDTALVERALTDLNDNRRIEVCAELIKPISTKVWGARGHRFKSNKTRSEAFCNSISFVLTTCNTAAEMEIPYVDKNQRNDAMSNIAEAIDSLRKLSNRVKGAGK